MDGLLNLNKFLAYLKNSIAWMKPAFLIQAVQD